MGERQDNNRDSIVYIMGASRSGSTILGVLLDQADGTFFAGELCEWPERGGETTISQSHEIWSKVRSRIGTISDEAISYKRLYEHPAGLLHSKSGKASRQRYEDLTRSVLLAVMEETGCQTVIDSSHYPRRARTLRHIFGKDNLRLVFIMRKPSSVARSFRNTGDKGWFGLNAYLTAVALLSWFVYLTHPRERRIRVGYEELTHSPLEIGAQVLGRPLNDVDLEDLPPSRAFIGNRLLRSGMPIRLHPAVSADVDSIPDRVTDMIQWPYRIKSFSAGQH